MTHSSRACAIGPWRALKEGRSRGRLSAYSSSLTHPHTPTQLRMSASCANQLGTGGAP